MDGPATYSEFWPFYLREHSKPATRAFHYFGTALALGIVVYAIAAQQWGLLLLAVISGYLFAWISHGTIEKNKPATFKYPLWSLFSDFRMFYCMVTGQIGHELKKAGVE